MVLNCFQTARADVTLEELQGVDPNVLTLMFQEQLRLTKRDAAFREMPMRKQGFAFQPEQAQQRFATWKQQAAGNPMQQDVYRNNVAPGQPKPQRPFGDWAARQDSPAGRFERNRKTQQELDRSQMLLKREAIC